MAIHDPRLDLVSVAALLLTSWLGRDVAEAVGAYTVIFGCGFVGSGFGLSRAPSCNTLQGIVYMARMTALACIVTVPAVQLASWAWPGIESRWLIAPAATVIAGIGHDWPAVIAAVLAWVWKILQRKADSGQEQ